MVDLVFLFKFLEGKLGVYIIEDRGVECFKKIIVLVVLYVWRD